jgi:phosphate transport system substrate-binding protein
MVRRQGKMYSVTWRLWLSAMVAIVFIGTPADAGQAPGSLLFAGSGSSLPIMRLLADAFTKRRPDVRIENPANLGSTGGIRAVADGAITVGLVSRPLRAPEKELGLTVLPYARSPIILAVHPKVAEDAITADDLVRIYQGIKTRWGDGSEIVVLTREPGDTAIEALESAVPAFKAAHVACRQAKRCTVFFTEQEMIRALADRPRALGLTDLGTIRAEGVPVKPLAFNGVRPTPEEVQRGRYPLVRTLAFVFRKGQLPAEAAAFLAFVRSKEGEKILRANEYILGE